MDKAIGYVYSDKGDMKAHEFFLYSLVRGIRPRTLLEIGVRTGISTMAMTQAIADGGIHCDYHVCDIDNTCTRLSLPIPVGFHIMTSNDLAQKWTLPLDLLMIDGCHEYTQVYLDFTHFITFMNPGSFILFHDTNPAERDKHPGACWDAYRILEDLKKLKDSLEFVTLPYSYGLTIVRVIAQQI